MEKKNRIIKVYMIANENKEDEVYFSVRKRWATWVKEHCGNVSVENLYELALKDATSMLVVMSKDAPTIAVM